LILGSITGCTQPVMQFGLERCRQHRAGQPPQRQRRSKGLGHHALAQRPALQALGRRALHLLVDDVAANVEQLAVLHAAGAGRFAVAAGQAAVQVGLGLAGGLLPFEHLLDQVDAAARAVELIAQQLVGGAGGGAKAAMHALAQNGLGLLAFGGVFEFGG
jgi:hypothetical protein